VYTVSAKNKLSLFAAFNTLEHRRKNNYSMHTIKITPNLLFGYQCTSGEFIRLPNRIESKLFLPELECSTADCSMQGRLTTCDSTSRSVSRSSWLWRCCFRVVSRWWVTVSVCGTVVGWLGSPVVSVLDSGAEGPGFKSQSKIFGFRKLESLGYRSVLFVWS